MTAKMKPDLSDATVAELRAQAKDLGISGFSHMHKDELISAMQNTEKESASKSAHPAKHDADAIELLKKDHAEVHSLFEQALSHDDGDKAMVDLASQIILKLTIHTEVEEKLFYPALKKKSLTDKNSEAKDQVLEAYVEHNSVKQLLAKIAASKTSDESYKAFIQVASEQVQHHVEEEEQEMFRQAKKLFSKEELAELGRQIVEMKDRLTEKV